MAIDHPNAKRVYFVWEGTWTGPHQGVVVVETDLQLNAQHPDFSLDSVQTLLQAVNSEMEQIDRQIDHFRLVSAAKDQI